ncbi:HEPN domain-containing protein [Spirosoma taeanense]|uniref:HEPN domain-containing protein n=1 Tax=Spirosoma taeanense TaxID=2735870 RepID=A0A6M5Y3U3_9BACT|nr:HEPN domain-containing protein [Spirosoma taeanense]QJW88050.1 HEPN domain-containing protein [Spirosoma taeanense]
MSRLYEASQALERAEETLQESAYNLEGGFPVVTVNRAYYAVFYCLTALLHTEGVYTKRHSGAHGKFHELFVRTNRFPAEAAQWAQFVFQLRQAGDYDLEADITDEQAQLALAYARQFFTLAQQYINNLLSSQSE